MSFIRVAVRQPVTVAVGVILIILTGLISLRRIPIQLTPNVQDTVIAVTTFWEGASPDEIEQDVVDKQEEQLQGIPGLRSMTSRSIQGQGRIKLEFGVGTSKELALREVSDKLREVPDYPENVDEPFIEASDPESRDFIAWIVLETTDPDLDVRTLQDFVDDRIKPILERVPGMAEVNVLGGREREVQVRFDPLRLAERGITVPELIAALQQTNLNVSAGTVPEAKSDIRVRFVSQYTSVDQVARTVVRESPEGKVLVRDLAEVVETYKEPFTFVRSRGESVIAINAMNEVGTNVMQVMAGLREAIAQANAEGGPLDILERERGLKGDLILTQVYDQTVYIDDALALVERNIWLGGGLAMMVLLLFLRSIRSAGIVALAIPISVIGAVVAMVAMGRTVNVISLAGMAFAVGMVVDNAIVVLENIHRHLEMGKSAGKAAVDGTQEVYGAILASTLTTMLVFIPILLVQEEAGQLFRDIALAIVAAVFLSLIVSITVIPASAARLLRRPDRRRYGPPETGGGGGRFSRWVGDRIYALTGSVLARVGVVALLTLISAVGTLALMPPADYLPSGNRNLIFGMLVSPPGYNMEQQEELGARIDETIAPFYEAGALERGSPERAAAEAALPAVPTFNMMTMRPGEPIVPPPLENYFLVSFEGMMFHGGISADPERAVDLLHLFSHATRAEQTPGVLAFGFQVPLFQLGGFTGSAVKINFSGDDLDQISRSALAVFLQIIGKYGPMSVQPDPPNFNLAAPELQVLPDLVRLSEVGMSPSDLGRTVQAFGDGAIIGEYRIGGESIDLKVVARGASEPGAITAFEDIPIATPVGGVTSLASLARLVRTNASPQINRNGRQRSVTLQFTPPPGLPLEQAIADVKGLLDGARQSGSIPPNVVTSYTGSASKLEAVRTALLGDGTVLGLIGSSLFLALVVVYLLLCVLFQSFLRPLVIMFSVPLATLGGFAALYAVYLWSVADPYLPVQNLDVLTMLGFVILIGIVVNNAILIVHQAGNFMEGLGETAEGRRDPLPPRKAIAEAVRTRVRPIFMSTLTSIGGMAPLVLMPGSGSELYRGLGSVVIGGLLVSTVFTLVLVPLLLSLVLDLQGFFRRTAKPRPGPDEKPGDKTVDTPTPGGADGPEAPPTGPTAGAVLILATLGLAGIGGAGCRSSGAEADDDSRRYFSRAVDREVALAEGDGSGWQASPKGSEVDDALRDRVDELDEMAGPKSFDGEVPDYGLDLSGGEPEVRRIGLQEAILSAIEHNLGLRAARLGPADASNEINFARARFDPTFLGRYEFEKIDQPARVPLLNNTPLGVSVLAGETQELRLALRQPLVTGTTIALESGLTRFENRTPGFDFDPDPAWQARVGLSVTQNLLRGFGLNVNRAEIDLGETGLKRSVEQLRVAILDVVARTEQAYFDLVRARRNVLIQQSLLDRGRQVKDVLEKRQVFDTEPAQYTDALATVKQREADRIRAQRIAKVASDRLKAILNDPDVPLLGETVLDPADPLDEAAVPIDLAEAVRRALMERPEVRASLLRIDDAEIRETVAKNLLLPGLSLRGGIFYSGLDGNAGGAISEIDGSTFVDYLVGVNLEVPIGNRAASARADQARRARRRAMIGLEQAIQDVVLDVKVALREVQTSYELIEASRAFRIAQTENLRTLLAREETLTALTPEFLALKFSRQDRLAISQREETQAITEYNKARSRFRRALGIGLSERQIELKVGPDIPSDERIRFGR
ncbi:MAG: efflux RND transporter permease subunit [Planctomycetota bacterium]|nr:efflux RND transporter permease subunit [Planctomycetota bacterium]